MRNRMGWIVMLLSVGLVVGCKHQTSAQKEQAKLAKEQAAADKEAKKHADEDARAQRTDEIKVKAMQSAGYYPDDRLKVIGYPDILPENRPHWVDKHAEAMAAAGASNEATLYESDFQGNELSPDGQSRLRLMMKDPPPTIFVATLQGNDAQKQARFAAITRFWLDATSKQVVVKEGVNQNVSMPANAGLNALQRLDKQSAASPGSSGSSSSMSDTTLDNRSITGAPAPGNP